MCEQARSHFRRGRPVDGVIGVFDCQELDRRNDIVLTQFVRLPADIRYLEMESLVWKWLSRARETVTRIDQQTTHHQEPLAGDTKLDRNIACEIWRHRQLLDCRDKSHVPRLEPKWLSS